MSAVVKLGSALPGDEETNGLDQQAEWLIDHPKDALLALVWLDVKEIKVDTDRCGSFGAGPRPPGLVRICTTMP